MPVSPPGLLLLSAPPDKVASWAEDGLVAARVVPAGDWTALCPVAGASHDDLELFAARPVPAKLRPAVGLFVFGRRAVLTVHPGGRRAIPQWLVWQPGEALVAARPLRPGRLADLAATADHPGEATAERLAGILLEPSGEAAGVLREVMEALELPQVGLVDGSVDPADVAGSVLVEPSPKRMAKFLAVAHEDAEHRAELEGR